MTRLFVTSITIFEIHFGLIAMPSGKRRRNAGSRFNDIISTVVASRILHLDTASARAAAEAHAARGKDRAKVDAPDSLIAGLAREHGATVATRNIKDFSGLGITLVDPWMP